MTRTVRSANQLTMFDEPVAQRALFDGADDQSDPPPIVSKGPPSTREEIHEAMHETIAMLRACDTNPWNRWHVHFQKGLFRLRAEWFPADISGPLQAAFDAEAVRLDFANAPEPEEGW